MKVLIIFLCTFLVVFSQGTGQLQPDTAPTAVLRPNPNAVIDEPTFCLIGNVATLPPKPLACANPNEIFACGYGEARCDGLGFCGTVS